MILCTLFIFYFYLLFIWLWQVLILKPLYIIRISSRTWSSIISSIILNCGVGEDS